MNMLLVLRPVSVTATLLLLRGRQGSVRAVCVKQAKTVEVKALAKAKFR